MKPAQHPPSQAFFASPPANEAGKKVQASKLGSAAGRLNGASEQKAEVVADQKHENDHIYCSDDENVTSEMSELVHDFGDDVFEDALAEADVKAAQGASAGGELSKLFHFYACSL